MYLARIVGNMVSTDKYDAYDKRKLLIVQKLDLEQKPSGPTTMAIDYVGAGEGDIVLVGAAPGLASTVFGIPKAPIRELIMAIVDHVETAGAFAEFGNSVTPPSDVARKPAAVARNGMPPQPKPPKARR
jgi:ethanolamine utilization protein EutN